MSDITPQTATDFESVRQRLLDAETNMSEEVHARQRANYEKWQAQNREMLERERQERLQRSGCGPEVEDIYCWDEGYVPRVASPRPHPHLHDPNYTADLLKYIYATMAKEIAELQYTLAEATGTGRMDPELNHELQRSWCYRNWKFLYGNTIVAACDEHDSDDWVEYTHFYSDGTQAMTRKVDPEALEAERTWPHNEHTFGDGATAEYLRSVSYRINTPPADRKHEREGAQ